MAFTYLKPWNKCTRQCSTMVTLSFVSSSSWPYVAIGCYLLVLVVSRCRSFAAMLVDFQGVRNLAQLLYYSYFMPNYEAMDAIFKKFCKRTLIMIIIFRHAFICVGDLETYKKVGSSPHWANRWKKDHYTTAATFNKPMGIISANGEYWRQNRSFVIKMLTELEFYNLTNLENAVRVEFEHLNRRLGSMLNSTNGILSPSHLFQLASANVVFQVILGQRYEENEPRIRRLITVMNRMNQTINLGSGFLEIFPWLRHVPKLTFMDDIQDFSNCFYEFFQEEVLQKRRLEGMYRKAPHDLADYYLLEIDKHAGTVPNYFTDETFKVVWRDLFAAGADTSSLALEWALYYMALHPEAQDRVHQEIDEIIGMYRPPAYADKCRMIYTEAVLLESLRLGSVIPATNRCPLSDTKLDGKNVPEGSICGISIYSIHRDEKLWTDPESFQPDRFISSDGQSIINKDKIVPFGYGTRICIGKNVANVTLFIFFASFFQKYKIEAPKDHALPSKWRNSYGMTRSPPKFYIRMVPRIESFIPTS